MCVCTCLLQAMESKLLAGGKNIVDRSDQAKKELETKRQEVIEQQVSAEF